MLKRWMAVALVLCALGLSAAGVKPARAENPKTFRFVLWTTEEKTPPQVNDLIKRLVTLVFEKIGAKVKIEVMPREKALAAIRANRVDVVPLWQSDYADLVRGGKKLTPLVTTSPQGHLKDYRCVILPKNSPAKGVKDLRGKHVLRPMSFSDYVGDRWFLQQKGINMPLSKFFGPMVPMAQLGGLTSIEAVAAGKLDGAFVGVSTINLMNYAKPAVLKKVRQVDCHELPWPNMPVVWVGKPDPKLLKKLYDVLQRHDSYPEFKQLKPILKIVKQQLFIVSEKDYAPMVGTFNKARRDGWDREFKALGGR